MQKWFERLDVLFDILVVLTAARSWLKNREIHPVIKQEPHRFLNGMLGCFLVIMVLLVCGGLCFTTTVLTGGISITYLATRFSDSIQAPSVPSSEQAATSPLGQTLQSWGYVINLEVISKH